eukprot:scaffold244841_cov34-Tisochrysis_lutea.AAC.2
MDLIFSSRRLCRSNAIKVFQGVKNGGTHVHNPDVAYYQADSLTLEAPKPMLLNFDGENVGYTPLRATLMPKAVRVFVPDQMAKPI